ncbi:hypothetical protein PTKIN_Ptkin01aG0116200 [Pterospermum kingtungense]
MFASRQQKVEENFQAETSTKTENFEDRSQNIDPIVLMRTITNQQRPGQITIPRDYGSSLQLLKTNQLRLPSSIAASSSLQQQQINLAPHQVNKEQNQDIGFGRTIPINPITPYEVQKGKLAVTGPHSAGLNESVELAPLGGWPLDAPKYQQEFQILNRQRERPAPGLSHMHPNLTLTFPGSSAKFNYRNLMILPDTEINEHNRLMIHMLQTGEHQNQDNVLQQPQAGRTNRKLSNSRLADKQLAHHKTLDSIKAEENKAVDVTAECSLSYHDDNLDNTSTPFSILRCSSDTSDKSEHKGFTLGEVSFHSSKSKVLCCHFSSDGKFLASVGHEKKVLIWNMETLDSITTSEDHSLPITDVRFRPSSTLFATSSLDSTVQIWDSAKPSRSLFKLEGHAEQVFSLDFHPRKVDLLCSCDSNNEMRLWNINQGSCIRVSKGAAKQVRFQPNLAKLIATASGNIVNVIDFETNKLQFRLKGHNKEVQSICWHPSGRFIASISEDSARVWSMSGGECLHELRSAGNKFQSCTFHPRNSHILVIGGYQFLELWNPVEGNKTWTVEAHRGLISSLAASQTTEMVASTSHDQSVKIWKPQERFAKQNMSQCIHLYLKRYIGNLMSHSSILVAVLQECQILAGIVPCELSNPSCIRGQCLICCDTCAISFCRIPIGEPCSFCSTIQLAAFLGFLKTAVAPFGQVKLLMKNQNEMVKPGRLSQPYNGIFDCFARTIRNEVESCSNSSGKWPFSAGVLFLVYPFLYAGTRMANDVKTTSMLGTVQFNGVFDVYRKTLKSDGIAGVHRGYNISLAQVGMNTMVSTALMPW